MFVWLIVAFLLVVIYVTLLIVYRTIQKIWNGLRAVWDMVFTRTLFPKMLAYAMWHPEINQSVTRKVFSATPLVVTGITPNHTHPKSAAHRNSATDFVHKFAETLGLKAFSSKHGSNRRSGNHTWKSDKDLAHPITIVKEHGISYYIDDDYHDDDFGSSMAGLVLPTLLYTTVPSSASCCTGETSFTFDEDNVYHAVISGGARYSHKLHDFGPDSFRAVKRFFGIPYLFTSYLIEKRRVDEHKQLVLLTPVGTFKGIFAIIANSYLSGQELQRLEPVHNGFAVLQYQSTKGGTYSISRCGKYGSATVSADIFARIESGDSISKTESNTSTVATWLSNNRDDAVIIAEYMRAKGDFKPPLIVSLEESIQHYSANVETYGDDVEKDTLKAFSSPLIGNGSFAPTTAPANAEWAVKGRIEELKKTFNMTPLTRRHIEEFNHYFLQTTGVLYPDSVEEIRDSISGASRKAIHDRSVEHGSFKREPISSFLKRESYSGCKTPRVISTIPGLAKVNYSRFTRPLGRAMKAFKWYGFKVPVDIANRVVEIVAHSETVAEGDFTRMDGNVVKDVRDHVEKPLMQSLFPQHSDEVVELMALQYDQPGQINGYRYESGDARASGSPETSVFNTILTAAINYSTLRRLGMGKQEAWESLGVYAGDDSLSSVPARYADKYVNTCITSAKAFGQDLKIVVREKGQPVTFLARYYGGAWFGSNNSITDPVRCLSKIHTSVNLPDNVKPEDKAYEKGKALIITDGNTPIIGEIARKYMSVGGPSNAAKVLHSWWSKFDISEQFPNEYEDWMDSVIHEQMPDFNFAQFNEWISTGNALRPPMCWNHPSIKVDKTVIVGDKLLSPDKPKRKPKTRKTPEITERDVRSRCKPQHVARSVDKGLGAPSENTNIISHVTTQGKSNGEKENKQTHKARRRTKTRVVDETTRVRSVTPKPV